MRHFKATVSPETDLSLVPVNRAIAISQTDDFARDIVFIKEDVDLISELVSYTIDVFRWNMKYRYFVTVHGEQAKEFRIIKGKAALLNKPKPLPEFNKHVARWEVLTELPDRRASNYRRILFDKGHSKIEHLSELIKVTDKILNGKYDEALKDVGVDLSHFEVCIYDADEEYVMVLDCYRTTYRVFYYVNADDIKLVRRRAPVGVCVYDKSTKPPIMPVNSVAAGCSSPQPSNLIVNQGHLDVNRDTFNGIVPTHSYPGAAINHFTLAELFCAPWEGHTVLVSKKGKMRMYVYNTLTHTYYRALLNKSGAELIQIGGKAEWKVIRGAAVAALDVTADNV